MRQLRNSGKVMLVVAMAAFGVVAAPANGTPASGFTAAQQWKGTYAPIDIKLKGSLDLKIDSKDNADVYVTRNAIAAGGQSGWHSHPGPSLITVTVGTIKAYESTAHACGATTYHAGEGFVDYGDHAHLLRNESGAAAETVAVQFLPTGATRRIDEPKPTNCSF